MESSDGKREKSVSHYRIAFVGDPNCGKAEVRRAYIQLSTAKGVISELDSNVAKVHNYLIQLLTIDRESEFNKITQMNCSHLDAVILFYDISNPTQFERAHNRVYFKLRWIPLIKQLYKNTPLVICATCIEARQSIEERESILRTHINYIRKEAIDSRPNESDIKLNTNTAKSFSPKSATNAKKEFEELNYESVPKSPVGVTYGPSVSLKLDAVTRLDCRQLVPTQLGEHLSSHYGANVFKEVSYRTFEGIQSLLEETVAHVLKAEKVKYSLIRGHVGLPLPRHIYRIT